MKINTYLYIIAAVALLAATACNETEPASESSQAIRFAGPLQTKVYTDAASQDFIFQVRDIYNGGSTPYISNTLAYVDGWGYGTGAQDQYNWKNGSHNLFGWLHTDGFTMTSSFFGAEPTLSGTTLSIPAKTLTNQTDQYDFLYSQSVQRNTSANDYSDVPLIFKHLFAQVGISFAVDPDLPAGEEPVLKEIYLNDKFKNTKSATIDFAPAGDPDTTFTAEQAAGLFATPGLPIGGILYSPSTVPFDVLRQIQSGTMQFFYIWPMSETDLHEVITVKYGYPGEYPGEYDDREIDMSFPKGTSWKAGNKYSYTISYMGGILKVNETVLPWEYDSTTDLQAASQSAVASWVGWDVNTCTVSGQNVTFKSAGTPVRGLFRINSPTSCTYSIELAGADSGKFSITGGNGTIGSGTGDKGPGQDLEFSISSNGASTGDEVGLVFSVTVGGHKFNIDSEVQRDGKFTIKY